MPNKDCFSSRMKEYEQVSKNVLMKRTPVAIRLDGKAFHTFAKNFDKPFDTILTKTMQKTMLYLCENIQGCVFGYTQSDEITLILVDSSAWFDNEVQKICSVSASMATLEFNRVFRQSIWFNMFDENFEIYGTALEKGAMFDSRCFNIPREEVTNLIYWRQLDAMRNSVLALAQNKFSQKFLEKKSCEEIKGELAKKGIIWGNLPIHLQRGTACIKSSEDWELDTEIPIFKGNNREYIEKYLREEK